MLVFLVLRQVDSSQYSVTPELSIASTCLAGAGTTEVSRKLLPCLVGAGHTKVRCSTQFAGNGAPECIVPQVEVLRVLEPVARLVFRRLPILHTRQHVCHITTKAASTMHEEPVEDPQELGPSSCCWNRLYWEAYHYHHLMDQNKREDNSL